MATAWLALWLVCTAPDVCTSKQHYELIADQHACLRFAATEAKVIWNKQKLQSIRYTCISVSTI